MSRVGLESRLARSVRQNPRTERAGMPWSAVQCKVPRFVNFGLGESNPPLSLNDLIRGLPEGEVEGWGVVAAGDGVVFAADEVVAADIR